MLRVELSLMMGGSSTRRKRDWVTLLLMATMIWHSYLVIVRVYRGRTTDKCCVVLHRFHNQFHNHGESPYQEWPGMAGYKTLC